LLSSRIAVVNEIATAINNSLSLDEILQVVANDARWLLNFEHCSVYIRKIGEPWGLVTLFGPALDMTISLDDNDPIQCALRTGQRQLIHTDGLNSNAAGAGMPDKGILAPYSSLMIIPLQSEGGVIGTLNFATTTPDTYNADDYRISYLLALQIAAAIRNAERFQVVERAQLELQRYAAELEARNHELDAYSHTIAHDLKAPLTQIVGFSSLTMLSFEHILPKEAQDNLNLIQSSALKMSEMIEALLRLAHLRDAATEAEIVEMNPLVDAAFTRFYDPVVENQIKLDIQLDLPPALGHGPWIEEVFANLIGNAIKYIGSENPAPYIAIRGYVQGNMIRYEVQDNGLGIALENQTRLFDMFTRMHNTHVPGYGLGLSIVHRIVTKLNGEVGVISEPGVGSTFWFTLVAP